MTHVGLLIKKRFFRAAKAKSCVRPDMITKCAVIEFPTRVPTASGRAFHPPYVIDRFFHRRAKPTRDFDCQNGVRFAQSLWVPIYGRDTSRPHAPERWLDTSMAPRYPAAGPHNCDRSRPGSLPRTDANDPACPPFAADERAPTPKAVFQPCQCAS